MKHLLSAILLLTTIFSSAQENQLTRIATNVGGCVTFSGYAMAGWEYHDRSEPDNQFAVNKIIMLANANITSELQAFIMYDFNKNSLHEYWANYKITPWLNVKLGQFKTPSTLENPISPAAIEMITLTSLATNYMVAGSSPTMMPAGAGRDIGITLFGKTSNDLLSYDIALMNGEGRNHNDANSSKDIVGRLTVKPISEWALSVSGIYGRGHLDNPEKAPWLKNLNQEGNFTRQRLAAGTTLNVNHFKARTEYMWGRDGHHDGASNGGYMTCAVTDVATKGLDFVASADHLDPQGLPTINRIQAGVQYWFYPQCRLQIAVSNTHSNHITETGVLTQMQIAFMHYVKTGRNNYPAPNWWLLDIADLYFEL